MHICIIFIVFGYVSFDISVRKMCDKPKVRDRKILNCDDIRVLLSFICLVLSMFLFIYFLLYWVIPQIFFFNWQIITTIWASRVIKRLILIMNTETRLLQSTNYSYKIKLIDYSLRNLFMYLFIFISVVVGVSFVVLINFISFLLVKKKMMMK